MKDPQGQVSRARAFCKSACSLHLRSPEAEGRAQDAENRLRARPQRPGRSCYVWIKRWKLVRVNS